MSEKANKAKAVEAVEEIVEAVSIDEVAEAPVLVVAEKFVKVIPKSNGSHFIGGTWYHFEKDKEVEVTLDAKRVLKESGAIYL